MEHKPAVYALERLHAEIGGRIKDNRKEAAKLAVDMKHVEAVIRMLEPSYNVASIAARRRNRDNPYFKRGECFRHVLSILRTAPQPLTSREITVSLLKARGVENPTTPVIRGTYPAVHSSLKNHKGKTVQTVGEGMPAKWVIIPS